MIKIKNACIEDLPAIVDIYNSAILSRVATADTEPVTIEDKLKWFNEHNSNKYPIWVMEVEDTIVGWLSLQPFKNKPAYYKTADISIYISPKYHRKGIGKELLINAIKYCPEIGIDNLIAAIFAHNTVSLEFFKKFNFQHWGYLPKVTIIDGIERDVVIWGLRVF